MERFGFYVINLDDCTERLPQITAELDVHNIAFERIAAIRPPSGSGELSVGAYGCKLSHYKAYRRFLDSDSEYGVIMEDDGILMANFKQMLMKIPDGVDICFLGYTHFNVPQYDYPYTENYNDDFVVCRHIVGTPAYVITRKMAEALLSYPSPKPIDVAISYMCNRNGIPIILLKEPVVYDNLHNSNSSVVSNADHIAERMAHNRSLYRRDYAIDAFLSLSNDDREGYPKDRLLYHLNIGNSTPYDDVDLDDLDAYRTTHCTVYAQISRRDDIGVIGTALGRFRYLKRLVIEVEDGVLLERIPFRNNMVVERVENLPEPTRFPFIKLTKYPFTTHDTFNDGAVPKGRFIGHNCDDVPVHGYYLNGDEIMVNPNIANDLSALRIDDKYNLAYAIANSVEGYIDTLPYLREYFLAAYYSEHHSKADEIADMIGEFGEQMNDMDRSNIKFAHKKMLRPKDI